MDFTSLQNITIPLEDEFQADSFSTKDGTFKAKLSNVPRTEKSVSNFYTCSTGLVVADPFIEKPNVQEALYMQEKRAEFNECERERRKAQVDVLEVDDNGRITVRTLNTRKTYASRILCNFARPELVVYSNNENEIKVYCIHFWINRDKKEIYVRKEDAGNGHLLLKKFNSVGADFLIDKMSRKISAALQLLALLLKEVHEEIIIATEPGWYEDASGEIKFCKTEDLSWNTLMMYI